MRCPKCGSSDVRVQTFQEQRGSKTITKHKFKGAEKRHGIIWWLFIGCWWWLVDLMLWTCFFPFRCLYQLFHRRKYKVKGKSVSETVNQIGYRTICTCQSCGKQWRK